MKVLVRLLGPLQCSVWAPLCLLATGPAHYGCAESRTHRQHPTWAEIFWDKSGTMFQDCMGKDYCTKKKKTRQGGKHILLHLVWSVCYTVAKWHQNSQWKRLQLEFLDIKCSSIIFRSGPVLFVLDVLWKSRSHDMVKMCLSEKMLEMHVKQHVV